MGFGKTKRGQFYKKDIPTLRNIVRGDSETILKEKQKKMKWIEHLVNKKDISQENKEKIQNDIQLANHKISFLEMRKQDAVTQILVQESIKQRIDA